MRVLTLLIAIGLAGCSSEGERAEKRFQMVDGRGSARDACTEAGRVKDAYLSDGNQAAYEKWVKREGEECAMARLCASSASGC